MALTWNIPFLFIVIMPIMAEIDMKFTKNPESVTAPVGDSVTFVCEVNVPGEKLLWRSRPVDSPEGEWENVTETGSRELFTNEVTARLVFEVTENTQSALYQCVVLYGSVILVSIPARLSVARLDLSNNTPEQRFITAPPHNTIVLHCKEPESHPPAILSWWKEGPKGTRKQLETPHGVLVIHNATTDDSGTYGCKAINEFSSQTVDLPERTRLNIQPEGNGDVRFLESEEYVGVKDGEGVLTLPVVSGEALRLWCGAVGTPAPKVTWAREIPRPLPRRHDNLLTISPFTADQEGIYSCSANDIRRAWKVVELKPPHWEGLVGNLTATEGNSAHFNCGTAVGYPPPTIYWVLNGELLKNEKGTRATDSDLHIDHLQKRHAGIVQCFACNKLGCSYLAAMLTVVPLQISEDYPAEIPKASQFSPQQPKRHNRKNFKKNKSVMIPPSRPNVTRLSDQSVMVSWSHAKGGLPIRFFKVQYKEATNTTNAQWNTATQDIPPHINSYEIEGLTPDKFYKFRIAAVYSNQDNKQGRSSSRFFLQRADKSLPTLNAPVLVKAEATSPHTIQVDWTWSRGSSAAAEGFYVYYRAQSSAGAYAKALAGGNARSLALHHLAPDTRYELKLQAYTAQAPSDFSSIKVAMTHKDAAGAAPAGGAGAAAGAGAGAGGGSAGAGGGGALVPAAAALGAALVLAAGVALLLCWRARRHPHSKENGSAVESPGANGYMPAKVPITITANPMHSEGGEPGVEMSFLHNNNTGNNDDTLPHSRKNGPAPRRYV